MTDTREYVCGCSRALDRLGDGYQGNHYCYIRRCPTIPSGPMKEQAYFPRIDRDLSIFERHTDPAASTLPTNCDTSERCCTSDHSTRRLPGPETRAADIGPLEWHSAIHTAHVRRASQSSRSSSWSEAALR